MLAGANTRPLFERPAQSWLAVASAEHVARGRTDGFMQVCHGKGGPLKRLHAGDRVVYYSPTGTFGGKDRLQAFTAIGEVCDRAPYTQDMGGGFVPFRRDVAWWPSQQVAIAGLLPVLDWTRGNKNWGYSLRFGLLLLSEADMDCIAAAMCPGMSRSDRQVERLGSAVECG